MLYDVQYYNKKKLYQTIIIFQCNNNNLKKNSIIKYFITSVYRTTKKIKMSFRTTLNLLFSLLILKSKELDILLVPDSSLVQRKA